jgi:muramoyltetrapeptide carboxypeptidase
VWSKVSIVTHHAPRVNPLYGAVRARSQINNKSCGAELVIFQEICLEKCQFCAAGIVNIMSKDITYPPPLTRGDSIGVTAPSSGVGEAMRARFDVCVEHAQSHGYKVKLGECLFSEAIVSASAEARTRDLHALWAAKEVRAIIPPWGGELLINMLDQVDFDTLAHEPKWLVGWSDITTLLLPLTTRTGIASMHGINFMGLPSIAPGARITSWRSALGLSRGDRFTQHALTHFSKQLLPFHTEPTQCTMALDTPTRWRVLGQERAVRVRGRLIGGCLDTIAHLAGTRFGDVPEFARTYALEGTLVYLENCDFTTSAMTRALYQLRYAGWFDDANAIVLGRSTGKESEGLSNADAIADALGSLAIPVLYDFDIGHAEPQMVLINGAMAEISYAEGRGTLAQALL